MRRGSPRSSSSRPRTNAHWTSCRSSCSRSTRSTCRPTRARSPRERGAQVKLETHTFGDDGSIPNSSLPVLIYHHALERGADAGAYEEVFAGHGWLGAWRDGMFAFHHFHSTAHEVLGIVAGSAEVVLGGPQGCHFHLVSGDVVVLPAGTGH